MSLLRIDKMLCDMQIGTRSEVKNYIKKKLVTVNGAVVIKPDFKVNTETDKVSYNNKLIEYASLEYYMLNKPDGVLSATNDKKNMTVIDLISDKKRKDLFPVGRLDKDTVGLLIITNDGELAHNLLSPKKHVPKTYYAISESPLSDDAVERFAEGIELSDDNFKCKPAKLDIICNDDKKTEVYLTITEGKFHQVKRMIHEVGGNVVYLKRVSMGDIILDENLKEGEYRPLTEEEINILRGFDNVK